MMRAAGAVLQPLGALGLIAAQPLAGAVAADPVVPAGRSDVAADFLHMAQHRQAVPGLPLPLSFRHPRSPKAQETQPSTTSVSFIRVHSTRCTRHVRSTRQLETAG